MRLGDTIEADGRWRVFLFADSTEPASKASRVRATCAYLEQASASPIRRYTPANCDMDGIIDVRAIFQQDHRTLELGAMPALLRPRKGRYGLTDDEKMFSPDLKNGNDMFDMRAIDRGGCMVVVRPDQYVAQVLPLDAYNELAAFFDRFMVAAT